MTTKHSPSEIKRPIVRLPLEAMRPSEVRRVAAAELERRHERAEGLKSPNVFPWVVGGMYLGVVVLGIILFFAYGRPNPITGPYPAHETSPAHAPAPVTAPQ